MCMFCGCQSGDSQQNAQVIPPAKLREKPKEKKEAASSQPSQPALPSWPLG
jgi:hypothetical protein